MRAYRLSDRQEKILEYIEQYVEEHGYPPSMREIGEAVGISSTSVTDYNLNVLEREGYLRRDPERSRGINLVGRDTGGRRGRTPTHSVPVIGRIAAGEPIEAVEDREQITLTPDIAEEGVYALRVKGKSMIEDCIDDGDLVIVRRQETANNGDIVVALVTDTPTGEGQATLKRFYRERDTIRLQPANSTMEPIYVSPEALRIQGRVVSVIRQFV
jgi:repressor LexA